MQNLSTTHRQDIAKHDDIFVPAGRGKTAFIDVRDIAAVAAQEQVKDEARWAQQAAIGGVPFFIVNHQYAWSGAQPPEAILQMLKQIVGERS